MMTFLEILMMFVAGFVLLEALK